MPPAHSFLRRILHGSRQRLRLIINNPAYNSAHLSVVFGNESGDLDSFASSLLYTALSPPPHPVPVFAVPRGDLSLRPELLHLLSSLQLVPEDVICADDKPALTELAGKADVYLVDHNRLTLPFPAESVKGIIDHHDDEGLYAAADPRVIEKSGSCSSLVVEELFEHSDVAAEDKTGLAKLALAAILIDTANLTSKVTKHDVAAVETLERALTGVSVKTEGREAWNRDKFYRELYDAKQNVENMSLRDLLRKDYKEWTEAGKKLGISSIVKGLAWMKDREGEESFLEGLRSWGAERQLDVLGVMTTVGQGDNFQRELLVWELEEERGKCLGLFADRAQEAGLQLSSWEWAALDSPSESRRAWKQGNLAMSRKQVAPLLRECLRAHKPVGAKV